MTSSPQEEPITIVPDFLKETLKKFPTREAYGEWDQQTEFMAIGHLVGICRRTSEMEKSPQASNIKPWRQSRRPSS